VRLEAYVTCRCDELDELEGAAAAEYVQHLSQISVDNDTWEAEYVCPVTGARWTETYPNGGAHGGGSPILRRMAEGE
jgi:hypothetical protein